MSSVSVSTPDVKVHTGLFAPVRRLYDWVLSWAQSPWGPAALFVLSFIESSFFPIPPDPLLIALCLGAVSRSLVFALNCTVASVFGGLFGYVIGMYGFDAIGLPILELYGIVPEFEALRARFLDAGVPAVLVSALTPIPYKLITITAGVANMNVAAFVGASILGRGLRFFGLAALIWWKGEAIGSFIERYFEKLMVAFAVLLVGGFVAFSYLF